MLVAIVLRAMVLLVCRRIVVNAVLRGVVSRMVSGYWYPIMVYEISEQNYRNVVNFLTDAAVSIDVAIEKGMKEENY